MSTYTNRSITLTFDENTEPDIIDMVEQLSQSRKLSNFVSNLLRIASENPELIVAKEGRYTLGNVMTVMDNCGVTPARSNFMASVNKKTLEMSEKFNRVYDMCQKLYVAAKMGDRLEIEKRTDNLLSSAFILNSQIAELQKIAGTNMMAAAPNKIRMAHEYADETLEYIIEMYGSIIEEMEERCTYSKKAMDDMAKAIADREKSSETARDSKEIKIELSDSSIEKLSASLAEAMRGLNISLEAARVEDTHVEDKADGESGSLNISSDSLVDMLEDDSDTEADFSDTADFSALSTFFSAGA